MSNLLRSANSSWRLALGGEAEVTKVSRGEPTSVKLWQKVFRELNHPNKAARFFYQQWLEHTLLLRGGIELRIKCFLFGVEAGKDIRCYGGVDLMPAGKSRITIGDNVCLMSDTRRCTASSIYARVKLKTFCDSAEIILGDKVDLNGTSIVARSKKISIGARTMIAPNVTIVDSDFHSPDLAYDRRTCPGFENDADVFIGENVWIGMGATVLKGVRIGDNSIIGAGSIVACDIPANAIAVGSPAKVIKTLTSV